MNEYQPELNELISRKLGKYTPSSGGAAFGKRILGSVGQQRDNIIIDEVIAGNVPDCVANFVPITVLAGGNLLQYYVSGDVLSVGTNSDYLRVSLNGKSAKRLCDTMNCMLPTKKMADDIWRLADLRIDPEGLGASASMTNTQVLINSNNAINRQVKGRSFNLLSGHKKDVILAKYLLTHRDRLSIYGWFYRTGVAIQGPQPNSSHHDVWYQDYSHGIRLVSRRAQLNNQPIDLYDVLSNPQYAYLVSEEGAYNASSIYI